MNCTLTISWMFYVNPSSRQKKQTSSKPFGGSQARVQSPVKLTRKVFLHHYSLLSALPNSNHKGLPPSFGESTSTLGGHRSFKESQRQKETWEYRNTYQTVATMDLQDNVVMLDTQLSLICWLFFAPKTILMDYLMFTFLLILSPQEYFARHV